MPNLVEGERDQPAGVGVLVCSLAQLTARKAMASIDGITRRRQEVQVRTWCSSSPAWPLALSKDSPMVQRRPAAGSGVATSSGSRRVSWVESLRRTIIHS